MKEKALSRTNPFLKERQMGGARRVRSIASSTAIETGESVKALEKKIIHLRSLKQSVTLA